MSDLIERQKAIDALMEIMDRPKHADFLYTDEICKTLNELPSAQPEIAKRTAETAQNVSRSDLISRKAAIEAVSYYIHNVDKEIGTGKLSKKDCRDAAENVLEALPSAQPEIIHCKDCKYCSRDAIFDNYWCNGKAVTSNHYCGYAERREDDQGK